ncbi:hypothetical protein CA834_09100 [Winogradskyella aurantia]|uniref:Uncharacterized protein n=1 Tax=Winogradskyella aurantia TaxID=1915063 RepID=A0A265UTJ3_9FLAO|nr:hypothetical protein CA834_09100 [Winogradskyella aurantia]
MVICASCKRSKEKEARFILDNFATLEFIIFEQPGKSLLLPDIKLVNIQDTLGTVIGKNPRRYEYLLKNRINVDSFLKVLTDTTKAKAVNSSFLNNNEFQGYFYSTFYDDEGNQGSFREEELMKIGSKFFLAEKMGHQFRTRICVGINGLDEVEYPYKDYTLLEALVYEALFERLTQENAEEPTLLQNLDAYSSKAISSLDETVMDSLDFVRASAFDAMENDDDLKTHLLGYIALKVVD